MIQYYFLFSNENQKLQNLFKLDKKNMFSDIYKYLKT